MKPEKIRKVLDIYRRKFENLNINKADYPHGEQLVSSKRGLEHCHGMLEKVEGFIRENRMDKVFRWLGFIQGVLWDQGLYTLSELMNHNRKDVE